MALTEKLAQNLGARRKLKIYAALLELAAVVPYPALTAALGPKMLAILKKHKVKEYEPRLASLALSQLRRTALAHRAADADSDGEFLALAVKASGELMTLNPHLALIDKGI
jgi:hypothetical protein